MHDAFADIVRRFAGSSYRIGVRRAPSLTMAAHEASPTVIDVDAMRAAGGPHAALGSSAEPVTRAISTHWATALADLEGNIAKARKLGGFQAVAAARAAELAKHAGEMVSRVARTSKWASELQAKVDRLEASGRDFRMNFGHAIDVLVHDRSR